MKINITIISLIMLLALFISNRATAIEAKPKISKASQVILNTGDWVPSALDSKKALKAIEDFLANYKVITTLFTSKDFIESEKKKVKYIYNNFQEYKVQFIGIIKNGKKKLYCKFFAYDVSHVNWKEEEVVIKDGGFWVWNIIYDPKTNMCSEMAVNGRG